MANYIGNQIPAGEFKKLDSIEAAFNNVETTFDLTFGTTNITVGDATQLQVSINGVIQEPLTAYTLANGGKQIQFLTAPTLGASCFIILFGGVGGTSTPTENSITTSKIVDGAVTPEKLSETYLTATGDGSQLTGIDALPDQTGQTGNYLTTDGSTASWDSITQYTPPTDQGANTYLAGDGTYKSTTPFYDDTTNTVVSATLNANTVTFTRQDATTFDLDVTNLYDDTNLVTSVNGSTGAVTIDEYTPPTDQGATNFLAGDGTYKQSNVTSSAFYEHSNVITANYSINNGNNAMSAGPITIDDGGSVTVPSGSTWTIV